MSPSPRFEAPWVIRAREGSIPTHSHSLADPDGNGFGLHVQPRGTPLLDRIAARQDAGLLPTVTVADLDQPFQSLPDAVRYGLDPDPDTGILATLRRLTRKAR